MKRNLKKITFIFLKIFIGFHLLVGLNLLAQNQETKLGDLPFIVSDDEVTDEDLSSQNEIQKQFTLLNKISLSQEGETLKTLLTSYQQFSLPTKKSEYLKKIYKIKNFSQYALSGCLFAIDLNSRIKSSWVDCIVFGNMIFVFQSLDFLLQSSFFTSDLINPVNRLFYYKSKHVSIIPMQFLIFMTLVIFRDLETRQGCQETFDSMIFWHWRLGVTSMVINLSNLILINLVDRPYL
jgi:hypothetical protein